MISCLNLNANLTVEHVAQQFLTAGFSILPLIDKKPAHMMRWSVYRQHHPTASQIDIWFMDERVTGYGIICGKISSNLLVIDCDDISCYEQLIKQFPKLDETYTVKTRRGFHIYLYTNQPYSSRSFDKVDLKGEGGYVVGAGSIVNGHLYTIDKNLPIQELAANDIQQIEIFLNPDTTKKESDTRRITKQETLLDTYCRLAPRIGRNNALFKCALLAKTSGYIREDVVSELAKCHSITKPFWKHVPESPEQRYKEAIRTIASAYKSSSQPVAANSVFLPNNIREKLLQTTNSTIPGRLLEALLLEGYKPNQSISWTQAIHCGAIYKISRSSIAFYLNYETLFTPVGEGAEKSCKSNINRGRPQSKRFTIPSIDYLCAVLDVEPQSADPIDAEALSSPRAYRMALHRALIERLQPEYSANWHANRLGVSKRTIQQYNQEMQVKRTPVIAYQAVNWDNINRDTLLDQLDQKGNTPGRWLQRKDGRRYPAKRGIALRLLAAGQTVFYCKQRPSRYSMASSDEKQGGVVIWRYKDDIWTDQVRDIADAPDVSIEYPAIKHHPKLKKQHYALSNTVHKKAMRYLDVISHDVPANDLTQIRGIGKRRAYHLNALGIRTFYQLAHVPADVLCKVGEFGPYVYLRTVARWINEAHIDTYGTAIYDASSNLLYDDPTELSNLREDWYWQKHAEVLDYYRNAVDRLLYVANQTDSWRRRWCFDDDESPTWWNDELKPILDEFQRRSIYYRVDEIRRTMYVI